MCQQKYHAVNSLIAAVVLHGLGFFLSLGTLLSPLLLIQTRPNYDIYPYTSQKLQIGVLGLTPPGFSIASILIISLGMLCSIFSAVLIGLRAYRLRQSLRAPGGGGGGEKSWYTRAQGTLLFSLLSTLFYIVGSSIAWSVTVPLSSLLRDDGATVQMGPADACASLCITTAITASILEGVSHCCCKVRAAPTSSLPPSSNKFSPFPYPGFPAAPPGYVLAFIPASAIPPHPSSPTLPTQAMDTQAPSLVGV